MNTAKHCHNYCDPRGGVGVPTKGWAELDWLMAMAAAKRAGQRGGHREPAGKVASALEQQRQRHLQAQSGFQQLLVTFLPSISSLRSPLHATLRQEH